MLFNSFEYLFFLPVVFILYWFVFYRYLKVQNILLIVASYFFYGWWDWRFLFLIIFSSFVDYFCGLAINEVKKQHYKKTILTFSLFVNLGFLGVFKYFNFFSQSLAEAMGSIGYKVDALTLDIILPVGISFYTFQTMSYTIDIYRGKLKPTKDIVSFFAFVSFFPQLVAGPIERATNLLPQFYKKRKFDFAFQIYGDFSGYSDIAIGTSRLFGFHLMKNFAFPYFSRDIAEFWRRWHISLSTWFRDYVYIPLGGSRGGNWTKVRNTFIIFIVSGFWHGANWTFIAWGILNALCFLPLLLLKKNRVNTDVVAENSYFVSFKEMMQVGITFTLVTLGWIFFRADSITIAFDYIGGIFSLPLFVFPDVDSKPFLYIAILIFIEWFQRKKEHGLEMNTIQLAPIRWSVYIFIFCLILFFGAQSQSFIYFQF